LQTQSKQEFKEKYKTQIEIINTKLNDIIRILKDIEDTTDRYVLTEGTILKLILETTERYRDIFAIIGVVQHKLYFDIYYDIASMKI